MMVDPFWLLIAVASIAAVITNDYWYRAKSFLSYNGFSPNWSFDHWKDLTDLKEIEFTKKVSD